jgi:phospholipid transport system substrate-binding protein
MSPRSTVVCLAVFATLGAGPGFAAHPAVAADGLDGALRPLDLVRSSVAGVQAIVRSQPNGLTESGQLEVRHVAQTLFDFDEMSRRMLARYWNDGSPSQQAEFIRLLTNVFERSYLSVIGNSAGATITFEGESVDGAYAQVRRRGVADRRPEVSVEYRLMKTGERWAVYDVVHEGASLVSNYRGQLNSILRTSSFAQLLDRMRSNEIAARVLPRHQSSSPFTGGQER